MSTNKQRDENRIACGTTETKHGMRRKMCLVYTAQVYLRNNNTSVQPCVCLHLIHILWDRLLKENVFIYYRGKRKITLCISLKLCVYVTEKMNQC